ncbi:MAG: zf-HC2 domain-containing protein [Elusimicrobia bacterium]|nr:zf-HC2 domain-containing protein [Elusimicrobiota bacterium]
MKENLSAFVDGELSADERRELKAHVAGCPGCARELQELQGVSSAVRAHGEEHAPAALGASILREAGRERGSADRYRASLVRAAAVLAAAAVLLVFLGNRFKPKLVDLVGGFVSGWSPATAAVGATKAP